MFRDVKRFFEPIPLLAFLLFMLAACAPATQEPGDAETPSPANSGLLPVASLNGTRWLLESYGPAGEPVAAQSGVEALLAFDNMNEMHGETGCNNFFQLYSIEGLSIETGDLERTRFACPGEAIKGQDAALMAALASLESIGLEGETLVLAYDGGLLRFFEEPPPPVTALTGTTWHLASIRENGVSLPLWSGSPFTAEFAEGLIQGDTGCNGYGGEYKIDGSSFTVKEIAQSAQGCLNEGLMERESIVTRVLPEAESFSFEEDTLTIFAGEFELIFAPPGEGLGAEIVDPLAVVDLSRRAFDLEAWDHSLHGGELIALGFDGELRLLDLESGELRQLTDDGRTKFNPVISEEAIAWLVDEGEQVVQVDGRDERLRLQSIVVYDRESGEEHIISAQPAPRSHLVLDGKRLVWMDKRNEMGEYYSDYDLYAYDLESRQETVIAAAPGAQANPALHGDLVVWQDNRHSPHLGTPLAGCDNCPDNRFDIYLYDFATGESRPLVEDGLLNANPSIYGRELAWEKYSQKEGADIFIMDIDSLETHRLTETADPETRPQIDGDRVLWHVSQACDVIQVGPDGEEVSPDTGVYLWDLADGATKRLTDYVEPRAEIDGDIVVILEGCMTGYEAYQITLPARSAGE